MVALNGGVWNTRHPLCVSKDATQNVLAPTCAAGLWQYACAEILAMASCVRGYLAHYADI